jgi:hypothetical protein
VPPAEADEETGEAVELPRIGFRECRAVEDEGGPPHQYLDSAAPPK